MQYLSNNLKNKKHAKCQTSQISFYNWSTKTGLLQGNKACRRKSNQLKLFMNDEHQKSGFLLTYKFSFNILTDTLLLELFWLVWSSLDTIVFVPKLSLLSSLLEIAFWLSPVCKSILNELVPSPESPPLAKPY